VQMLNRCMFYCITGVSLLRPTQRVATDRTLSQVPDAGLSRELAGLREGEDGRGGDSVSTQRKNYG
jgi:hypothetical protein